MTAQDKANINMQRYYAGKFGLRFAAVRTLATEDAKIKSDDFIVKFCNKLSDLESDFLDEIIESKFSLNSECLNNGLTLHQNYLEMVKEDKAERMRESVGSWSGRVGMH